MSDGESTDLMVAMAALDRCDGYVILLSDPQTDEIDVLGPHDGLQATVHADRLRREMDRDGLHDVVVRVVRLHTSR